MRVLLLFAGIILSSVNGQASVSTRVLGGAPTTIERCPIVAQLLRERVQYCAAVVLTARHVLSAAHCILADPTYNNPKLWKIRVGSSYRTRGGVLHDVKTIITHPGFDKRIYNNDVAVLVASKPFTLNKYVRQGTIPKPGTETKENSKVTLIGWGVTTNDPNSMQPDQMRYATLRTIDHATCQKRYSNLSATITEAMMSIVKSVGFFAVGVVVASECAGLEIMPSTPQ
ncbi:trypsin CFT-1 [Plutella xylostella]|uniref:trypsin CFT-1 n=1 Tax=Plutella xylostella TaxID=51655 RepID=UPI00203249D6|nr:trypsin CFT-1 [Plutella xylostella]